MSDKLKIHPGIGFGHPDAVAARNLAGSRGVPLAGHSTEKAALGKAPLHKRAFTETPEIHSGMNAKSRSDGTHFAGLSGQDLSRYDADGPNPLSGPPRGKRLSPVAISPGMRSRTNEDQPLIPAADLAKAVMDEAADNSAPDDRRALGIGTLADHVTED